MTTRYRRYKNNWASTITSSISNVATTISLAHNPSAGDIAPGYYVLTLFDDAGNYEIIELETTNITGSGPYSVTSVIRGSEDTTAQAWPSGTSIEIRSTKTSSLSNPNFISTLENLAYGGASYNPSQDQQLIGTYASGGNRVYFSINPEDITDAYSAKLPAVVASDATWVNDSDDTLASSAQSIPTNRRVKAYVDNTVSAAGNNFNTIAVSGQSNVVADSASDTLTLVAGGGITITTNATTDTVTISTSGVGSQTPWTANIDVNGYVLTNTSTSDGVQITTDGSAGLIVTGPKVDLKPAGSTANIGATVFIYEGQSNGTNYCEFKVPDSLSANTKFQLPSSNGTSGYVLQTDGSGVTSWVAPTVLDGDKGDITVASSGATWTIDTPSSATVATDDKVLIKDTSASDVMKYVTAQSISDLSNTTKTVTQNLIVGGNSTAAGYIDFLEDTDNGSNKIKVTAPQSIASDKTVTLQDITGTVYVTTGTDVTLADGGTNASLTADQGAVVYSTSSALALLASTATANKMLLSGSSAAPTWSTSTIPTSAGATAGKHLKSDGTNYVLTTATISDSPSTSGKILISDGTNWITSTSLFPNTVGTSGKVIISDGTVNGYSTSTFPTSAGATANKVLLSDGTNYVLSTPTFPNASATTRKIIVSDGTNWTASTETYAVPGSSGNLLRSDGTNWTAAKATLTTDVTGTLPVANGGTAVTSVTTTPTATSFAGWDANSNLSSNNFLAGYTSTATAAVTTTLTVSSTQQQVFTGSTTQTCKMPVVSTLALGTTYIITNLSSGVVTAQSSGSNTIQAMAANTTLVLQSNATSGTGASVWNIVAYYAAASDITGSGSLVRATSPTLVTPAIGTPSSGTLTSCTGLPVSSGISGLGTGVATFLATPSSSNFFSAITDEDTTATSVVVGKESGTFTPTITFTTNGDLSVVYTEQTGRYVRMGDIVYIYVKVQFTPTYTTASGNFRISSLPFTGSSLQTYGQVNHTSNLTYPTSRVWAQCVLSASTSNVLLNGLASAVSPTTFSVTQITTGTAQNISLSLFYYLT